jgi:cellulose synthase operon protein YhjQ
MPIWEQAETPEHEALESYPPERGRFASGTPEDVAALYTWANIEGARYRDFSASRRRYREQVRTQAAQTLRDRAESGAEGDLVQAVREALAESEALLREAEEMEAAAVAALSSTRIKIAPRTAPAESSAETGKKPKTDSASSIELAARAWAASSASVPVAAPSRPHRHAPEGRTTRVESDPMADPLYAVQPQPELASAPQRSFREELERRILRAEAEDAEARPEPQTEPEMLSRSGSMPLAAQPARRAVEPVAAAGIAPLTPPETAVEPWRGDRWERIADSRSADSRSSRSSASHSGSNAASYTEQPREPEDRSASGSSRAWQRAPHLPSDEIAEEEYAGPAWLYSSSSTARPSRSAPLARVVAEPMDDPRQRAGARWSALRDLFDQTRMELRPQLMPVVERRAPLLIVFSLAGGVGKTSLLATLSRALSATGERVTLGDAAPHSLLPFYFGARDLRPGLTRAFTPPEGRQDAPIFVANYNLSHRGDDAQEQRHMVAEILRNGVECNRILLDLPVGAEWLVERLAVMNPTILVPLTPDMNSVISLESIERYFENMTDSEGNPVLPFYLLNQFDTSLALHLDVREVLRRQLGDRLLSFVIRRSPVVSEALAEGMTVVDYAPESPVSRDFFDLAAWLRTLSPPALAGMRSGLK